MSHDNNTKDRGAILIHAGLWRLKYAEAVGERITAQEVIDEIICDLDLEVEPGMRARMISRLVRVAQGLQ